MCLATALVRDKDEEYILAKNISGIRVEGSTVIMTDILGAEFTVQGTISSADLVNGVVKILAA